MSTINKMNDLLLRIELDLQKAKDALVFENDYQNAKNRLHSVIVHSKNLNAVLDHANIAKDCNEF